MRAQILSVFMLVICISNSGEATDLRSNEMIIGGGTCEADGFAIGGPSLYLRRGLPGVVVATIQPTSKNRSYAYLLLIKGDEQRTTLAKYDLKQSVNGAVATSGGFVEIAGKKVVIDYVYEQGTNARESLTINGETVDLASGRVVLIELSHGPIAWKRTQVAFSDVPTCPKETSEVEAESRKLLNRVRQNSLAARQFLK